MIEKTGVELKQRAVGTVVESKLTIDVKNSDAGCQLVKHATMCFDHARELIAHDFDLGAVDRNARAASSTCRVNDLEDATFTSGDSRQAADIGCSGSTHAGKLYARGPVKQFKLAGNGIGRGFRFDGAGIG